MTTPLDTLRHHVTGAIERGEKQAIVGISAQATQATRFRFVSYDVWGNDKDGYEVNAAYTTSNYYDLPDDATTDDAIFDALKRQGFFRARVQRRLFSTSGDDATIYLEYRGKPEGELRRVTQD